MMSDARIYSATAIVLLYLMSSVYLLWIAPRRRARASTPHDRGDTLIAFASQTGFAEQLAQQTARLLSNAGVAVQVRELAQVDEEVLGATKHALVIASTTGEGDAPDSAATFVRDLLPSTVDLGALRFGVLALGDRAYTNFCAFGHQIDGWLRRQGATPLFDVIEVDNGEIAALRHWQQQLSVISNTSTMPAWQPHGFDRWTLTQRWLANPGSLGEPCYHIVLEPLAGAVVRWDAGDILEIDPHNSTWTQPESPNPPREYSIASIPTDGAVHLLVRRTQRHDGTVGLGSGWLTDCAIGTQLAARIRRNRNFHAPDDARPLLLIGNGTGVAGLRALIKTRIERGHVRNWLIFGERMQRFDNFYADDITCWQAAGNLQHVDLVFSRDQPQKQYVQHQLLRSAVRVREWIAQGGAIYVCGSLEGMAPAVHAALEDILGGTELEELTATGRYRRDVY